MTCHETRQDRPMTLTLDEFLLARIAEDAVVALAAPGPRWVRGIERDGSPGRWRGVKAEIVALPSDDPFGLLSSDDELLRAETGGDSRRAISVAGHAARWDPARVLAECEAKRQLIALGEKDSYWDDVLRLLALPYADHPSYREEWRP